MNPVALHSFLRSELDRAVTVFALDEKLGEHHGLSWDDFVLLHSLQAGGTERQLASHLGLRGSTLLRRIRPLEKLGLISRGTEAGQKAVALRPAGLRVLREASETAAEVCADRGRRRPRTAPSYRER